MFAKLLIKSHEEEGGQKEKRVRHAGAWVSRLNGSLKGEEIASRKELFVVTR